MRPVGRGKSGGGLALGRRSHILPTYVCLIAVGCGQIVVSTRAETEFCIAECVVTGNRRVL